MNDSVNAPSVSVPPDTIAATGPAHIVEVVNSAIAIFDRTTGAAAASFPQLLSTFFSSVNISDCIFDPVVAFDELLGRFYIGVLDVPELCGEPPARTARLLYAVSDSSDPTAGFSAQYAIDVDETGTFGCLATPVFGDYPRTGWNADAHVFTLNMFPFVGNCFDHVSVIVIDKSTIGGALTVRHHDFDDTHFTITPATMHGASPGDPMWLVEEADFANNNGQNEIRVIKMTNVLSATPTFTPTDVMVAAYGFPPTASQKGGGRLDAGDTRMLHAEWRGDRLLATHTVGLSGVARARWYEFDTSGGPILTQQGTIDRGTDVHTYYPSIAIAPNGNLGMTFMQSSAKQFVSMYVTGQIAGDAPGTMHFPVLAKAGEANYKAFDCFNFNSRRFTGICRAGDYSGITVDPDTNDTFCAANEYARSRTPGAIVNWGTWITCFTLAPFHDLAVTSMTASTRARGGSVELPVTVTIQNRSDHDETIPDANAFGDGTATGLVRLAVSVIDNDNEACAAAIVVLNTVRNAAIFSDGPKILAPTDKVTVNFRVTYDCLAAKPLNTRDGTPGDYEHTATVHHDELDGEADEHAADDSCPRPPLPGRFDSNPPGIGAKDLGCGRKKPNGTFGRPVRTNVLP